MTLRRLGIGALLLAAAGCGDPSAPGDLPLFEQDATFTDAVPDGLAGDAGPDVPELPDGTSDALLGDASSQDAFVQDAFVQDASVQDARVGDATLDAATDARDAEPNDGGLRARPVRARGDVPTGAPRPGSYRVHLIDLGTGLSVLVQGADFNLLYDGGSVDDTSSTTRNRLVAYLSAAIGLSGEASCTPQGDGYVAANRPRLPLAHVVLSHPHRDHVSLLDDVIRCYAVADAWDPGVAYDSNDYRSFVATIRADGATRYHAASNATPADPATSAFAAGDAVTLGAGARFVVLHADASVYTDANLNSTVLAVELGDKRLLLTGDAESGARAPQSSSVGDVEQYLLQNYRAQLAADIFQVPHHGSTTSSRDAFLDAVFAGTRTRYALLGVGPYKYGSVKLPDESVVQSLTGRGAQVLRTDLNDTAGCPSERIGNESAAPGGCDNYVLEIGP